MLCLIAFEAACDRGEPEIEAGPGPALHLSASYPTDGQGTNAEPDASVDCDTPTPDCPVPTDVVIELRFDRYLLPEGELSSGLALYSGSPANRVALLAEYDLVERVVLLRPARALQPHALYVAELQTSPNPMQGFRAFDGAAVAAGAAPLRFSFSTGSGPGRHSLMVAASSDTCETLTEGPLATCAGCHTQFSDGSGAAQFAPMGLDLSSTRGLDDTAVAKVAHQTELADRIVGTGLQTPVRFGVQMNIVDPGNPATSYLMYKLLQKPDNFRVGDISGCPIPYHSPVVEGGCMPPSADEIARVREWFVLGEPMPENGRSADGIVTPVSTDYGDLRRIASWISAGAPCSTTP